MAEICFNISQLKFSQDKKDKALLKIDEAIQHNHIDLLKKETMLADFRGSFNDWNQEQFYLNLVHESINFLVRLYWTKSNYLESLFEYD